MANGAVLTDRRGTPLAIDPPGLILHPNIDADGRRLPRAVDPERAHRVTLDSEREVARGRDDELVRFVARRAPAIDPQAKVVIRFEGPMRGQLRLRNSNRRVLEPDRAGAFALDFEGLASLDLHLEARALPATPLERPEGRPSAMVLIVDGVEHHRAAVTVAPLLITNVLDRVERLYVCDVDAPEPLHGNRPTLDDIEEALRAVQGVAVVRVPPEMHGGDAWMQDQLQPGFTHVPGSIRSVVVDLPRARSNVVQAEPLGNLHGFVTSHFPSRDLGVFGDFWQRRLLSMSGIPGLPIPFADSYEIFLGLDSIDAAWNTLRYMYSVYAEAAGIRSSALEHLIDTAGPYLVMRWFALPDVLRLLSAFLSTAEPRLKRGPRADLARRIPDSAAQARDVVARARRLVDAQAGGGGVWLSLTREAAPPARVHETVAGPLAKRLAEMHDSVNFGGNVDASPPVADAPLGKVVIGEHALRPMDADLRALIDGQGVQPVVALDTSWLGVAHVDEMVSFVPAGSRAFAIAHASPGTAIRLLEAAREQHGDPPSAGSVLTDMLRGKRWLQIRPAGGGGFAALETPAIHKATSGLAMRGGEGAATLSVAMLLDYVSLSVNRLVQAHYIDRTPPPEPEDWTGGADGSQPRTTRPLLAILDTAFKGVELVPLPVLFDEPEVTSLHDLESVGTSAFLPNMVNLQVIGDVLLVPKPYGPRMDVDGAIATLKACMDERWHDRLTASAFERSGLLTVTHWAAGVGRRARSQRREDGEAAPTDDGEGPLAARALPPRPPRSDLWRIVRAFRDGFPDADDAEVERLIRDANEKHFDADGNLPADWRRLRIPERTVDLFEAYTRIRLEALGNRVRFVDSWYYHVRLGEIHCGTQVLRRPSPAVNWWEPARAG